MCDKNNVKFVIRNDTSCAYRLFVRLVQTDIWPRAGIVRRHALHELRSRAAYIRT